MSRFREPSRVTMSEVPVFFGHRVSLFDLHRWDSARPSYPTGTYGATGIRRF